MWKIEASDDFDEWLDTLEDTERLRVIATVELHRQHGPTLARPYADTIQGSRHPNMKELRPTRTIRVLFAFDPTRTAILLLGGDKRALGNRWYQQAIPKADALYDEHLAQLERKGEE